MPSPTPMLALSLKSSGEEGRDPHGLPFTGASLALTVLASTTALALVDLLDHRGARRAGCRRRGRGIRPPPPRETEQGCQRA
eukprot:CAMPEP_0196778288 /NCGR_PEP_ID=MMETSP1104-20130614/5709_1 /TAXON_ID=33652 /ORGANISM="Cafeteria sp., Strain Caron Lab Isolate" /LENGTH=81 /DNA_ID=CAMNT_0042148457 /DNA_START=145 /DNA_END=388 /DNA_ORIENTATION=-